MRKLETQEKREARDKRMRMVFGIFVIGILFLSTLGYALIFGGHTGGNAANDYEYQETETNADGAFFNAGKWIYYRGSTQHAFSYEREEIIGVQVDIEATPSSFSGATLYIDSNEPIITSELSSNLNPYAQKIQRGCLGECEEDIPEKTCEDNIIIYEESDENKVTQEDNCIFINGDMKAVDAFLYKLLGYDIENSAPAIQ